MLARLGTATVVLEEGAVRYPAVVEAVARGEDRAAALPAYARSTPAALLASPPPEPFWLLTSPRGLSELAAGGLRCGRGVEPGGAAAGFVLVRAGAHR